MLRVVATDRDVLLLDEPAAGLSPEERRDFARLLRHLRDALGKTVVLVEHDLDLVWRVADRITVLEAGSVITEGAPHAIEAAIAVLGLPREGFTSERLTDFIHRFEARTGTRAAISDREARGQYVHAIDDA